MERENFVRNFSERLNVALKKAGYTSRSKCGVEIGELVKVTQVSYQMARKYVLGLALPELHVVNKIAEWLDLRPSWLLFGETEAEVTKQKSFNTIEIESDTLRYILLKCMTIFAISNDPERVANFILGVIYDASHLNANKETIYKIIDMMLDSAIKINEIKKDKKTYEKI